MDCQAITKLLSQRTPRRTHLRRSTAAARSSRQEGHLAGSPLPRPIHCGCVPGRWRRVAHHASTWGWESTVAAERHGPAKIPWVEWDVGRLSGVRSEGGALGLGRRRNGGASGRGVVRQEGAGAPRGGVARVSAHPSGPAPRAGWAESAPPRSRSRCKRPAILNPCDTTCPHRTLSQPKSSFHDDSSGIIWWLVRSTEPCALRAWTVTDFAICGYSVSFCRAGGMVLHGAAGARISIGGDQAGGGIESEKARAVRQHRHRSRWTYSRAALHAQLGLGRLPGRQDAGLPVLGQPRNPLWSRRPSGDPGMVGAPTAWNLGGISARRSPPRAGDA